MMRSRLLAAGMIGICLVNWHCGSSQPGLDTTPDRFLCYYDSRINQLGEPTVYVDFIQFFTEEGPRVDMYIEVPHSNLYFAASEAQELDTEYTIGISLNDPSGQVVETRELLRNISTSRDLISRYAASDKTMQSFLLAPGEYRAVITILDHSVGNRTQVRERINVFPLDPGDVTLSDILLIRSIRQEGGRRVITPMLSERVLSLTEPFTIFSELYSAGAKPRASLRYGLVRTRYNNDFVIDNPFSYRVQRPYHRTGIYVENSDTVVIRDTTIALKPGTNQVFLPFDEVVPKGTYEVFLFEIDTAGTGPAQRVASTGFSIHTLDFPHMTDIDQQIDALNYIATTRELQHLRSGETVGERRKRLHDYWQNVGAWKMSDYYERVRAANELFTTNVEGWKTPMGMVFTVLGEPHIVECRIGVERMEIWTYYLQSGGMEFTFVRERGSDPGDPEAYYWISGIRGGYSAWLSAVNRWR